MAQPETVAAVPPRGPTATRLAAALRSDAACAVGLALAALGAYLARPAQFLGNDTRPAVYTAVSLAKRGDFGLDEFAPQLKGDRPHWPYFATPTRDGGAVSRLGMGGPLVALPVFAPVLWIEGKISESRALVLGRLVGALCVAGAAMLLFLTARRLGYTRPHSLLATLLYAFGTTAFSVASQALWQHGPAQLFLSLGMYCLSGTRRRSAMGAGAAFAAAVLCRPPDAVFALAAAAHAGVAWRRDRIRLLAFFTGASPLALAQALYNQHYFGAPWRFAQTSIVEGQDALPDASYWANDMFAGIAGLLFSPSRGILVYTPAFLFLAWHLVRSWRTHPPFLRFQLGAVVALVLVLANYYGWYGGYCFGYRMLADAAPALCLLAAPLPARLGKPGRLLYLGLVVLSIGIHTAGAYNYSPADWDAHPDLDRHRQRLWSITDSQLVHVFSRPRSFVAP